MGWPFFGRHYYRLPEIVFDFVYWCNLHLFWDVRVNILIELVKWFRCHLSQGCLHYVFYYFEVLLHFGARICRNFNWKVKPWGLPFFKIILDYLFDISDPVISQPIDCSLHIAVVLGLVLFEPYWLFFLFHCLQELSFHSFLAFGLNLL